MSRKKFVVLTTLALSLVISCGVVLFARMPSHSQQQPVSQNLPDGEIVFYVAPNVLGFIYPDGSGYTTHTVEINTGLLRNLGHWSKPGFGVQVAWSADGNALAGRYFRNNPEGGIPLLIPRKGGLQLCPENDALFGAGRVWLTRQGELVSIILRKPGSSDPDRVVNLSVPDCRELAQVYVGQAAEEHLRDIAVSERGWLAVVRWDENRGDELVILDSADVPRFVLSGGRWPAWSPGGDHLAYTVYQEGLYVVDKDGANARRLVNDAGAGYPSWSPDGAWLVYSRPVSGQTTIFRINVSTGDEVKLFKGGDYPSWRWSVSP